MNLIEITPTFFFIINKKITIIQTLDLGGLLAI